MISSGKAIPVLLTALLLQACNDHALLDSNIAIDDRGWSYEVMPEFDLQVSDTTAVYSLMLNLRHTGEYKYSNLFLLVHVIGPDKDTVSNRFEFTLAAPDGRWLGEGAGSIYSYSIPFSDSTRFRKAGLYRFQLEQNMREPVLTAIEDVGLRVEKR